MGRPRGAQRVLLALAAALIALGAWAAGPASRRPPAVVLSDDPGLEVRLDLNTATTADLETLPGVGTALASRIAADRSEHGPFGSVEDLKRVPGIGPKLLARLRPLVTVSAPR